ncbi:hypothetical protein [Paeniglutamicibacter sp. NPDC091659]|uniref:TRADD-N-associated membrane domain-containing protein n=1 Tax=Paeniglutamicibacter sp. NPDC091659 TaxID=3364389 RepID=UPI00380E3136
MTKGKERPPMTLGRTIALCIAIACFAVLLVPYAITLVKGEPFPVDSFVFTITAIAVTLVLFRLISGKVSTYSITIEAQQREVLDNLHEQERKVSASLVEDAPSFAQLWAVTQQRIDVYHGIATNQSKKSFMSAQVAMTIGFLIVVGFGVLAANASTISGAISAGAVGAVGAGLSAYIAATFIKSQSESSQQLREFFLQPVEFARMLSVERLIESLGEDDRPAAVQDVIRTVMPTPSEQKN